MSVSLSAERDRIQRQVEQLEQSLSATHTELELLSSETDDESDGDDAEEERQCAAGLLAQREKIKNEIQNLEEVLGPHSPVCVSDDDDGSSSSSEESELGLSPSADSCLQMNLVYQQVVQETLDQLETLLTNNHRQQKELVTQLSGPIRESPRERPAHPSCQLPITMYLGRFLKPYFKDKLTGLGPPANQETKEKANRMTGCLDDKKLKVKRWESWQKTLLIHSVTRDGLRRLIQPKLSKVDYLSQKLSRAAETDKQQLRQQITSLERDIELLRMKKDNELVGGRYDEHDWQKISNIDFEGTREAEDISRFWQNFLHPSVSKEKWSQDEVQRLKEVSRRHGERHWDAIAAELGTGRTAFLCLQTFQRYVSDSLKRGVWSPDEDALLRELVDKMRIGNFIPYTQMSYFMEGRDPAQLIYRWNQVLDPSLKKGSWTKEEDQLLLRAVSLFGEKDWWKIRFEVPGRTDCSCRDRYYDCLKAETKRGRFDQQEKQLLQLLVEKHGVGRWAKIASEIPLRYDAQCLREWRIMSRPPRPPKAKTTTKTSGGKKKKATPPSKKRKRRRVIVKEESSEEEEEEVQYMDSDEEKKTMIKEEVVQSTEEEEEEEEPEEEYIIPCMQDWVPAEKAHGFTSLSFRPVALPSSSGLARDQTPVRSTILGPFGRSVVLGPEPRELSRTERHGSVMMMVSPDQLRAHLQRQVSKYDARGAAPPRKIQTDRRSPLGRATDPGLVYELQAAVTPWIGNVLIPQVHRAAAAEALGPQGAGAQPLSSTQVFLLLLQTMSVDTAGCKDVIQQRRKRVLVLEPPAPAPVPSSRLHNSVAELLRQKRLLKDEQILNQLQMLQQLPPLRRPGVLLQMPPIMRPRMSSMSFPRAVFLPHPVSQPLSSSIGPMNPCRPLPLGVLSSVVPETLKATSTCSAASHQKAQPLTQNLMVALPCSTHPGPIPTHPAPAPTHPGPIPTHPGPILTLPGPAPSHPCTGAGADVGGAGADVGGAGADVGGASDGLIEEQSGRRLRKPSLKAREVDANKKAASSPLKRTQIQTSIQPSPGSPSMPSPQRLASSAPSSLATFLNDHHYASFGPRPGPVGSDLLTPPPDATPPKAPPKAPRRRRTRAEEQPDRCVIEKVQNPTERARPLQESKAETKKKKRTSPLKKRSRSSFPKREVVIRKQPMAPLPGFCLLPGQSMWVMTPGGLVQLAQAPPQGLQLTLVPSAALPAPLVCPLAAVSVPARPPQPKSFKPYKGAPRAPPLALQFDPSLMFLEPREAVCDWLSGRRGVAVPGAAVALPYLPPFVGSLNALGALLRSKTSLTRCSLKLLARGSEPQLPPTKPSPPGKRTSRQPPDLPDSTSDFGPPRHTPAPSVSPEEEELVQVLRQLVAERFSGNPAYQLLKARFLSCFTVPALLATVQPIREKTVTCTTNEEEEAEREGEELKKIKERGRQRRAERSLLLCDGSGAPANHFSGIHSAGAPLCP